MTCRHPSYAVHTILEESCIPFDTTAYSFFKFGNRSIARSYAKELAGAIALLPNSPLMGRKLMIFPSPYAIIPTASAHMTFALFDQMLAGQKEWGYNSITLSRIRRTQTYTADYGAMDEQERFNLISNDTYALDGEIDPASVLIFIDDISVTGTHQLVIESLLEQNGISNEVYFLYYAKLANKDIHPSIENRLNYAEVKSERQLIDLFFHADFLFTTRYVKRILSMKEKYLEEFIRLAKSKGMLDRIRELVDLACQNGYSSIPDYAKNLNLLTIFLID